MSAFEVLFAMPVTREAFFAAAARTPRSDYLRLTLAGADAEAVWLQRYAAIADAAGALIEGLRRWRVPHVTEAGLQHLREATARAQVVVLFAHWCEAGTGSADGGALELADGAHPPAGIEQALAPGFTGTLDLCSCTSITLAAHLKARRGDALSTIYNTELLDPLPAYVIVRELIGHCLKTGLDYRLARLQTAATLARSR